MVILLEARVYQLNPFTVDFMDRLGRLRLPFELLSSPYVEQMIRGSSEL